MQLTKRAKSRALKNTRLPIDARNDDIVIKERMFTATVNPLCLTVDYCGNAAIKDSDENDNNNNKTACVC